MWENSFSIICVHKTWHVCWRNSILQIINGQRTNNNIFRSSCISSAVIYQHAYREDQFHWSATPAILLFYVRTVPNSNFTIHGSQRTLEAHTFPIVLCTTVLAQHSTDPTTFSRYTALKSIPSDGPSWWRTPRNTRT